MKGGTGTVHRRPHRHEGDIVTEHPADDDEAIARKWEARAGLPPGGRDPHTARQELIDDRDAAMIALAALRPDHVDDGLVLVLLEGGLRDRVNDAGSIRRDLHLADRAETHQIVDSHRTRRARRGLRQDSEG